MIKKNYNVIGVMSGTSLDGIDLAYIHFTESRGVWSFEILYSETVKYSDFWLQILQKAVDFSSHELEDLNIDYTKLLGSVIVSFITKHKLNKIDAVCSHGHTILHQPANGITLQIGNLPEIATICQQKVICDFRIQDVRLGGQGAPLVPIGDQLLFKQYTYCLNLGGFSNISFQKGKNRIAFDISAVNTVLNFYANKLGFDYDDKGAVAATGTISDSLLIELNKIDYYQKKYPKSLGFEYVKEVVIPIIEKHNIETTDILATFVEHIAQQIAIALPLKNGKLLITGGGAYNIFLVQRMQKYLPKMEFDVPEKTILEYKEAVIFGLLGVLKLRNEINVLASVTGAIHDHSSGIVFDI